MIRGIVRMERNEMQLHPVREAKKIGPLRLSEGRIYFSRQSERRFYFFLTVLLLLAGIGYKMGLFS